LDQAASLISGGLQDLLGSETIRREIVIALQHVVLDPGGGGPAGVDASRYLGSLVHSSLPRGQVGHSLARLVRITNNDIEIPYSRRLAPWEAVLRAFGTHGAARIRDGVARIRAGAAGIRTRGAAGIRTRGAAGIRTRGAAGIRTRGAAGIRTHGAAPLRRRCRFHAAEAITGSPAARAARNGGYSGWLVVAAGRHANATAASVTPAPSVPERKAWMPHPRRMNSMAGTSTPYDPA